MYASGHLHHSHPTPKSTNVRYCPNKDPAALPCTLTHSESWSRFRVWWLAWAAVER
jgi:hypothetical protein